MWSSYKPHAVVALAAATCFSWAVTTRSHPVPFANQRHTFVLASAAHTVPSVPTEILVIAWVPFRSQPPPEVQRQTSVPYSPHTASPLPTEICVRLITPIVSQA